MKPKALMLSAAVLLGSAGLALAQTYSQPPQTPAGPTSPEPGTTVQQQNMNDNAPAGSKSTMSSSGPSASRPSNTQPGTSEAKQVQSQTPKTRKHRVLVSHRYERPTTGRDRATTALNLLEERGYRDFSTLRPMGRNYEISANQNGRSVTIVVNPDAKTVRTQG